VTPIESTPPAISNLLLIGGQVDEKAVLGADCTIVPSDAECKGMDFGDDGRYRYHPS
jgi:hypothetical protein